MEDKLRTYNGVRLTADGFDCALPVTVDSFSRCSYGCLYCFANQNRVSSSVVGKPLGQTSLSSIEAMLKGEGGKMGSLLRRILGRNGGGDGRPCPVQIGGLSDPCDENERRHGWLLRALPLFFRHNQPVRISTKGTLLAEPSYQAALKERPELVWVAVSCITPDDDLLAQIDKGVPSATERLAAMRAVTAAGAKVSLRLRPMLPTVSDRTPKHRYAYRELIERAAEAGASAVSTEVAFWPKGSGVAHAGVVTGPLGKLEQVLDLPFGKMYSAMGPRTPCMRAGFGWTEEIMHAVAETTHACGMTLGVSDPLWKQLGDTGCCCGILPDDPVFGGWQRQNATRALLDAKRTGDLIRFEDTCPEWASDVLNVALVPYGAGPLKKYERDHTTRADALRATWNDTKSLRGPLRYFQGALKPEGTDANGNLLYRYVGLQRQHLKTIWKTR